MIHWVFLDVGNILLNEDPLTCRNFQIHAEAVRQVRPDLSFLDILTEREARAAAGSRWPLFEVVSRYLDEAGCATAWETASRVIRSEYASLSPPLPGAEGLLRALVPRFHLGLIANQGPACRRWLDQLGWLDWFEVVALSEEEGVAKPDHALFSIALDRARVDPAEAIMVGDRLDNDIAPGQASGMLTAWLGWPDRSAKGWNPTNPDEAAYLAMLARLGDRPSPITPTLAVDDLAELTAALLDLAL